MRNEHRLAIELESYIAEPYWPQLDDVINIQKRSGYNSCRSEAKRDAALKAYLNREGIGEEEYATLVEKSQRRWYRDDEGKIIIPRHHVAGMLVQTVRTAPRAIRGNFDADSFRHHVRLSDLATNKTEKDKVFDRYVKNDATNQRRRSISEVICNCQAWGSVELAEDIELGDFKNLLKFALSETGMGACRKMGYGRGSVVTLE